MYIVSYLGSDGKYWAIEDDCGYREAIALVAEGERKGDTMKVDRRCDGHPAGPYDPMGHTVFCDGTCLPAVPCRPECICRDLGGNGPSRCPAHPSR
jgi:hypothetical protein